MEKMATSLSFVSPRQPGRDAPGGTKVVRWTKSDHVLVGDLRRAHPRLDDQLWLDHIIRLLPLAQPGARSLGDSTRILDAC